MSALMIVQRSLSDELQLASGTGELRAGFEMFQHVFGELIRIRHHDVLAVLMKLTDRRLHHVQAKRTH